MTNRVVGKPTRRVEGPDKVTGRQQYSADMAMEGLLWGRYCAVLIPMRGSFGSMRPEPGRCLAYTPSSREPTTPALSVGQ